MRNKKNIITLLCSLFILFALNSFANSCISDDNHEASYKQETPQEKENRFSTCSINETEGILQPSLRLNQNNVPTYQTLKNNKKFATLSLPFHSYATSQLIYPIHLNGLNNFTSYPFYIAFHRLII